MESSTDDADWPEGLAKIAPYIAQELLDSSKVATLSPSSDRDSFTQEVSKALKAKVIPFAEIQEQAISKELRNAQAATTTAQDQLAVEKKLRSETANELDQARKDAEKARAAHEQYIQDLRDSHQKALQKADVREADLNGQIKKLREDIGKHKKTISRQENQINTNDEYTSNLDSNYSELKKENGRLHKRNNELQDLVEKQASQVASDRTKKQQLQARIEQQQRDYKSIEKGQTLTITDLENKLKIVSVEKAEIQKRLDDHERAATTAASIASIASPTGSSGSQSSRSSAGAGTAANLDLAAELEPDLHEQISTLNDQIKELADDHAKCKSKLDKSDQAKTAAQQHVKDLEKEIEKRRSDYDNLKKERDDLQAQLKRATAKNDDNAKEIKRLKPFEASVDGLQRRERELQSQLKNRAQELKRAQDELKRLKQQRDDDDSTNAQEDPTAGAKSDDDVQAEGDHKDDNDTKADDDLLDECRADCDALRQQLEDCKDNGDALKQQVKDLQDQLEDEKDKHTADTANLQAQVDAARNKLKEYEEKLNKLQDGTGNDHSGLKDYFTNLFDELFKQTREVKAKLDEQIRINKDTQTQYIDRLGQINQDINDDANPDSHEVALNKKRAAGVQKEITRMNGIINVLLEERNWFEETTERLEDAQRRAEDVLSRPASDAGDVSQAEIAPPPPPPPPPPPAVNPPPPGDNALARNGRGGQGGPGGPGGLRRVLANLSAQIRAGDLPLWVNIITFFVMLGIIVAHGREFTTYKSINSGAEKRAMYINSLDTPGFTLKGTSWELLWEFIFGLLALTWAWSL